MQLMPGTAARLNVHVTHQGKPIVDDKVFFSATGDFAGAKPDVASQSHSIRTIQAGRKVLQAAFPAEDGTVLFRHVLIFPDSRVSAAQCEALLHLSIEACEHYYPAFQFVLWGGKSAQEAMAAAVLECAGQA